MDLTIKAERNVWIRNRLLDLELAGDVNIRKPGRDFLISGEMTTRQGRLYAFDHSFRVTQGVIRFDNPGQPDPSLDITAELATPIRDSIAGGGQSVKIIVSVTGTATQPVLTLSSDPVGMNQADIASYLATNILPEELASLNGRQMLGRLVSDRLLSLLSREVTSRLQSYLRLDVLELQTPTTGGGMKLTVSRYIGITCLSVTPPARPSLSRTRSRPSIFQPGPGTHRRAPGIRDVQSALSVPTALLSRGHVR